MICGYYYVQSTLLWHATLGNESRCGILRSLLNGLKLPSIEVRKARKSRTVFIQYSNLGIIN